MLVDSMEIFPINMELTTPIPMANGWVGATGNVVVKLTSDEGVVGWGEGVEAPALTHQRQADIVDDLASLRTLVVGAGAEDIVGIFERLEAHAPTGSTARGAIDIALHDLVGKHRGVPVHELIGGAHRDTIPALTLVGSGDPAVDAAKLTERAQAGFSWFKVKLGMASEAIEWETMSRAIDVAGPTGVVCGDANEAWDETTASEFLAGLEGMAVRFVEQPVSRDDPNVLLRVADRSPVAICADESAGSLADVAALAGTSIGGVSLKLIKHGGITGVMRGATICEQGGLQVNLAGKVIESSISAAANLHCAAAMAKVSYGCSPANQGVVADVTETPVLVENGVFRVPGGPGLGIEVDEARIRDMTD